MRKDSSKGMEDLGTSVGYRPGYCGGGFEKKSHPKSMKLAYRVRRHAKPIGMFLVLAAAAVMIASVAPALLGHAGVAKVPAKTEQGPPPPPYNVFGYVVDTLGAPVLNANVVVQDLNTGIYWNTTTDAEFGFYIVDLNVYWPTVTWSDGDLINVTVDNGVMIGWNESAVNGAAAYLQLDVTLTATIPEFPMAIVPVIGMVGIAAVVSLKRRRDEL